jgi:hypothetical protein
MKGTDNLERADLINVPLVFGWQRSHDEKDVRFMIVQGFLI